MPDEDKELIHTLASVKLSEALEKELIDQLEKISLCVELDKDVSIYNTSTTTDPIITPTCDFPEFQDKLNKLVQKYIQVFSALSSDVGRSTGNKITIRLAGNKAVNVRNCFETETDSQAIDW